MWHNQVLLAKQHVSTAVNAVSVHLARHVKASCKGLEQDGMANRAGTTGLHHSIVDRCYKALAQVV